MRGLWLEERRLTYREDISIPIPAEGEALIQVRLGGICSTDLEMARGYYPFTGILGHEFVGEVHSAPGFPQWVDKRVVGEINIGCGRCEACLRGERSHCDQREALGIRNHDGCFAEYLILPLENLHPIPDTVTDEAAVFTEPLAAALEIQQQVEIQRGQRVLVLGAGRLGQLIGRTLALTGCELWVAVRHPRHRELLEGLDVQLIDPDELPPHKMDVVVEVTGSPHGFQLARQALRARGTLVLKSTFSGDHPLNLSGLVVDEITLIGSRCGPFQPALELLEKGLIDPRPLIEARYPISNGVSAFDHAGQPGVLKVILEMN